MCYLLVVEKNRFWEKLILIAFHFRVKIDFFDKMIFSKNPKQTLKNEKSDFFKEKNLKQTGPLFCLF